MGSFLLAKGVVDAFQQVIKPLCHLSFGLRQHLDKGGLHWLGEADNILLDKGVWLSDCISSSSNVSACRIPDQYLPPLHLQQGG